MVLMPVILMTGLPNEKHYIGSLGHIRFDQKNIHFPHEFFPQIKSYDSFL